MNDTTEIQKPNLNPIKLSIILIIVFLVLLSALAAFFSSQRSARDQIRIKDITLIGKYLAAANLNEGRYPQSANNLPTGWQKYLETLPIAPQADGSCTADQNNYAYTSINSGQSYNLSFCLGSATGDFRAGLNTVSSN